VGWIRVSDDFYDNDKLGLVGPLGVALYFAAMGFCNRKLSDGYFAKNKAKLLLDFDGIGVTTVQGELFGAGVDGEDAAKLVISWMVAADLWHESGHDCDECHSREDGGEPASNEYLIHDYLKFQPSKAEVEAKAEANRKRVEAWREGRKGGNDVGNGVGNALRTEHVRDTPTPNPNPNNSLVNFGGELTQVGEPPPRFCSRHPEGTDHPCGACKRAREKHEAALQALQADELARKRDAKARIESCTICGGTGQLECGDDAVTRCECRSVSHA